MELSARHAAQARKAATGVKYARDLDDGGLLAGLLNQ